MSGWSAAADPHATEPEEILLPAPTLVLSSPVLKDLGKLPAPYHVEGGNTSPPLSWTETPQQARSIVIVLERRRVSASRIVAVEPDPTQRVTTWLTWANNPRLRWLPAGESLEFVGRNDYGVAAYQGPSKTEPRPRGCRSNYAFCLFALDVELEVEQGAPRAEIDAAMFGHVVAATSLAFARANSRYEWFRTQRRLARAS